MNTGLWLFTFSIITLVISTLFAKISKKFLRDSKSIDSEIFVIIFVSLWIGIVLGWIMVEIIKY